jgi:hypothetical protein
MKTARSGPTGIEVKNPIINGRRNNLNNVESEQ